MYKYRHKYKYKYKYKYDWQAELISSSAASLQHFLSNWLGRVGRCTWSSVQYDCDLLPFILISLNVQMYKWSERHFPVTVKSET